LQKLVEENGKGTHLFEELENGSGTHLFEECLSRGKGTHLSEECPQAINIRRKE